LRPTKGLRCLNFALPANEDPEDEQNELTRCQGVFTAVLAPEMVVLHSCRFGHTVPRRVRLWIRALGGAIHRQRLYLNRDFFCSLY